jgi:hypothetical protein
VSATCMIPAERTGLDAGWVNAHQTNSLDIESPIQRTEESAASGVSISLYARRGMPCFQSSSEILHPLGSLLSIIQGLDLPRLVYSSVTRHRYDSITINWVTVSCPFKLLFLG